jgi:hypothetical protein
MLYVKVNVDPLGWLVLAVVEVLTRGFGQVLEPSHLQVETCLVHDEVEANKSQTDQSASNSPNGLKFVLNCAVKNARVSTAGKTLSVSRLLSTNVPTRSPLDSLGFLTCRLFLRSRLACALSPACLYGDAFAGNGRQPRFKPEL